MPRDPWSSQSPPTENDPSASLDRLRTRLLDLTSRNRLLNYRHSKRGSLRAIDELPDQLFSRLTNGDKLIFRPVREPKREEYIYNETIASIDTERDLTNQLRTPTLNPSAADDSMRRGRSRVEIRA